MSYYKAIKDEMIVDVYDHLEFIRYDEKAKKFLDVQNLILRMESFKGMVKRIIM